MGKINNYLIQHPSLNPQRPTNTSDSKKTENVGNFQDILNQKVNERLELKMSKHAEYRLKLRNINLSNEQIEKVNKAVEKANEKGVKEALVLVDDVALVVSVKNKTVITVVDSKELRDNVFTNIDGAVIV